MGKRIFEVALNNSSYRGFITGLVTGGGKDQLVSINNADLEGFTVHLKPDYRVTQIHNRKHPVTIATIAPAMWTEHGTHFPFNEELDIKAALDLPAIKSYLKRGVKNWEMAKRIANLFKQEGISVIDAPVTNIPLDEREEFRCIVNGMKRQFVLIEGDRQPLRLVGKRAVDSRLFFPKSFPSAEPRQKEELPPLLELLLGAMPLNQVQEGSAE